MVFVLALTMGLRRGEVLGLHRDDVDLDARALRVRRAVQRVDGTLHLVPTKTSGSRRSIPIPGLAAAAIERHRALQDRDRAAAGGAWDEGGLLISTSIGTPVEPRNVNRRFYRVRERAGLPWLRLHDRRHPCATFLLAEGVDPEDGHGCTRPRHDAADDGALRARPARAAADVIDGMFG